MYYYQLIKDGNNISVKRYGSIADRTAQTSEQQTITYTWTSAVSTAYTDTADFAYIIIGSYGNYTGDAGKNYMYDFKFYSGVTTPPAKPTNVQDNSILVEKDTARRYWFDSGVEPTGTSGTGGDWAETSFNNSTIANNMSASGNVVTRTTGSGWNAYIRSNESISPSTGGGEIYFTQSTSDNCSVGLEKSPFNDAPTAVYTGKDYSFHTTNASNNIYEHTSDYAGSDWANATNEFRITMDSAGLVKYYFRSGNSGSWTLDRTSTVTASGDYYMTVSNSNSTPDITCYIKGTPATWTWGNSSQNGATHGYCQNGGSSTIIDRFAFSTDADAVSVGACVTNTYERGASSDITGGYSYVFSGNGSNAIERHQNATSANGSAVGTITQTVRLPSSSESSTHGYRAGGWS